MLSKEAQLTAQRFLWGYVGGWLIILVIVLLATHASRILADRARAALRSGRTRDAIRYGRWAVPLNPFDGNGYLVLGEALAAAGRPNEASGELMAGIALLKRRGIYVSAREYYILGCEEEKAARLLPAGYWLRRAHLLAARDWWRQAADMHEGDWSRLAEEKLKEGGADVS